MQMQSYRLSALSLHRRLRLSGDMFAEAGSDAVEKDQEN